MRSNYPWEEWFARRRFTLRRGVDYTCSQSTMVQVIRNRASKRGLRVRIIDKWDEITVEVKDAVPRADQAAFAE